jgi:hypothetical protein
MPTHNLPKLSEFKLQSQCFLYHWNNYPKERGRLFTVNNNSDNKIRAVINQSMGVVPGVADMMYLSDTGLIAIEFKTITGRQSPVQKQWQETIEAAGYRYYIVRSFEQFKETLNI